MSLTLLSPFAGTIHPIEEAPDPVFSMKMLGDGFFVTPSSGEAFSPVDGEITYVAPTKHGIRIAAADGTKVTLHIGTESGELKGEGFSVFVEQGAKVKKGDKLMTFSPELLRQNPKTTDACILLVEEMPEGKAVRLITSGEVAPLTAVAEIA
jgi:PTS system D-glucosamine-specific IIC component